MNKYAWHLVSALIVWVIATAIQYFVFSIAEGSFNFYVWSDGGRHFFGGLQFFIGLFLASAWLASCSRD